jgi:hypothetical protein
MEHLWIRLVRFLFIDLNFREYSYWPCNFIIVRSQKINFSKRLLGYLISYVIFYF